MAFREAQPVPRLQGLSVHSQTRPASRLHPWLHARVLFFCLSILVIGAPGLQAESLQTWSELEYVVARSSRLEWTVEGNFRFAETVGDLYDRRFGTKVEYAIAKGVSVGAGYVFRNRDLVDSAVNENRLIAGITYPIWNRGITIEGSTLYERLAVPAADFNRYKQQFEIYQPNKTLSPWFYQQFLFRDGIGFARSRSRFGVKWRRARYSLKAAYQFESRSVGRAWLPRHAIYTEIGIDRPLWFRE